MDADFPAAHSMDTEWFAVDADGHVGHFYSSEGGAVPATAQYDRSSEVWDRLAEMLPRCEAIHDLAGHLKSGPRAEGSRHHFRDHGCQYGALVFLRSLGPVKRQIGSGDATVVPASGGAAVVFRQLTDAVARRLHKDGHCLGCFFHFWFPEFDQDHEPRVRPAEVGLFGYSHPTDNVIALPYGREMVPSRPLHIDQLPPDLRALVGAMCFDKLRFADTVHLQPCEWDDVACWQSAYISADGGHIREIGSNSLDGSPTYEELYREMTAEERGWLKGITFDPPRKR